MPNLFRRAVIHVGLHKTGTTSLQNVLAAKQEALERQRVHYIPLEQMRHDLTGLLVQTRDDAARQKARRYLDAIDKPILLLSDENLIGGVSDPLSGKVYERAEARIRNIVSLLPGAEVHVFIVLRSPENFFPALYSEYLLHDPYLPFDEFVARMDLQNFSFHQVFGWIGGADLPVHWHFIPLEIELGGGVDVVFDDIVSRTLGEARSALGAFPDTHVRLSLRAEEMELIEAVFRKGGGEMASAAARLLASRPERLGVRPYRPLSTSISERLRTRYMHDLKALKNLGRS